MPGLRVDAPAFYPSAPRSAPMDIPQEAQALPEDPWSTEVLEVRWGRGF